MSISSLCPEVALTKTPPPATTATPAAVQQTIDLKATQVDQALGYSGKVNGGILQFSVPRVEKITDSGMEVPPAMGTATAINFQPTGGGKAAVSGGFVLLTNVVNPLIRALPTHGLEVQGMPHHMLHHQPHPNFLHFLRDDESLQ